MLNLAVVCICTMCTYESNPHCQVLAKEVILHMQPLTNVVLSDFPHFFHHYRIKGCQSQ